MDNKKNDFEKIQNDQINVNNSKMINILSKMTFISFSYMIIEYIVSIIAHSTAIKSDSYHMLADGSGYLIQLLSVIYSNKGRKSKTYTFNYYRLEIIGGLFNIIIILILSISLCYECIIKLKTKDYNVNSNLMIITSFVELLINLIIGKIAYGNNFIIKFIYDILSKCIPYFIEKSKSIKIKESDNLGNNFNYKTAILHLLSDMVYALTIFCVSIIIHFFPQFSILDPLCGIFYFIIMSKLIFELVKSCFNILMEGNPLSKEITEKIITEINSIEGVINVKKYNLWGLTTEKFCINCHIIISDYSIYEEILNKCEEIAIKYKINNFCFQLIQDNNLCITTDI